MLKDKPEARSEAMHAEYTYTTKTGEVIEVAGVIVPNRKHLSKEKFVTVKLDVPRDGKLYIACERSRLQPRGWSSVEV